MSFSRDLPATFAEALASARKILSTNLILVRQGTVEVEAELIVQAAMERVTKKPITRMDLYTRATERFPEAAGEWVLKFSGGRAEGKILQHLTGVQAFLEHRYEVSADALVPRPETELLAHLALEELTVRGCVRGIEIGLGSGVISIELLSRVPKLQMVATEFSVPAAELAKRNALKILGKGAPRLSVLMARDAREVLEPLERAGIPRANFLISNPPYLMAHDEIAEDVRRHEPALALFAPPENPLHFYARIAQGAARLLEAPAIVFCEVPHERAGSIVKLFATASWDATIHPDLTGRDRVLIARAEK